MSDERLRGTAVCGASGKIGSNRKSNYCATGDKRPLARSARLVSISINRARRLIRRPTSLSSSLSETKQRQREKESGTRYIDWRRDATAASPISVNCVQTATDAMLRPRANYTASLHACPTSLSYRRLLRHVLSQQSREECRTLSSPSVENKSSRPTLLALLFSTNENESRDRIKNSGASLAFFSTRLSVAAILKKKKRTLSS